MRTSFPIALAALFVAASAGAQTYSTPAVEEERPAVSESRSEGAWSEGRTREQVEAELACARASGEFQAMSTEFYDPLQAREAREQGANLPECEGLERADR